MWGTLILINSILLSLVSLYLVYSIGAMILLLEWKPFILTLIIFIFLGFAEVVLAGIAEP